MSRRSKRDDIAQLIRRFVEVTDELRQYLGLRSDQIALLLRCHNMTHDEFRRVTQRLAEYDWIYSEYHAGIARWSNYAAYTMGARNPGDSIELRIEVTEREVKIMPED